MYALVRTVRPIPALFFVVLVGRRARLPLGRAHRAVHRGALDVAGAPGPTGPLCRPAVRRAPPRERTHDHCAQQPDARREEREGGRPETGGDHVYSQERVRAFGFATDHK